MTGLLLAAVAVMAVLTAIRTSLHAVDPAELGDGDGELRWLLDHDESVDRSLLLLHALASLVVVAVVYAILPNAAPSVVAATLLLLVFGELLPRAAGMRLAAPLARVWAMPVMLAQGVLSPLVWVLSTVERGVVRSRSPHGSDRGLGETELLSLLQQGTAQGTVDPLEHELIESVFEFDEVTIDRLMTPRPDIFAVPSDISWDDLLRAAGAAGTSRIPVYEERSDDIIGVLLLEDLLRLRANPPRTPVELKARLVPPVFVPSSKRAHDLLAEFMERKNHMAFVVDEHGTLVGLVTLDDLLDELVGDLEETPVAVERVAANVLRVDAGLDVDDFYEETGLSLPEGEYHTVGGYVSHALGRLPEVGDEVEAGGLKLKVARMEERRIAEVEVHQVPAREVG